MCTDHHHPCISSCPNLLNEAYVPDRLDSQMTEQMSKWLANPTKGVTVIGNGAQISRIFLWFQGDFTSTISPANNGAGGGGSNEVDFIRKYRPDVPDAPTVTYFEYNWKINAHIE